MSCRGDVLLRRDHGPNNNNTYLGRNNTWARWVVNQILWPYCQSSIRRIAVLSPPPQLSASSFPPKSGPFSLTLADWICRLSHLPRSSLPAHLTYTFSTFFPTCLTFLSYTTLVPHPHPDMVALLSLLPALSCRP
jgi:hypothetical protein